MALVGLKLYKEGLKLTHCLIKHLILSHEYFLFLCSHIVHMCRHEIQDSNGYLGLFPFLITDPQTCMNMQECPIWPTWQKKKLNDFTFRILG